MLHLIYITEHNNSHKNTLLEKKNRNKNSTHKLNGNEIQKKKLKKMFHMSAV